MISNVLRQVKLDAPGDRIVRSFSGGQQARLLLAAALIQDADILLLDEPTNNLDKDGIRHLRQLIQQTEQTCVVISHDEAFLNSFTDSVLYLDIFSKKVEMYNGDYMFVKDEIARRIERENQTNHRLANLAQAKKDQANKFANKGGNLRAVAKRMRVLAADLEGDIADVRREDAALKDFQVPFTAGVGVVELMEIRSLSTFCHNEGVQKTKVLKDGSLTLRRGSRVLVHGPNGVGKTTFLETIANGNAGEICSLESGATVGYYRQDFHNFDFESTALSCLESASGGLHGTQEIRATAGAFMLKHNQLDQKVKTLSEGQKGLLSLACLVLQRPSILIMDEPTNHINFRHLPALANAIHQYEGAVLLVSHDHHFVDQIKIEQQLDMGYELDLTAKEAGIPKKKKKGGKGKGKKKGKVWVEPLISMPAAVEVDIKMGSKMKL